GRTRREPGLRAPPEGPPARVPPHSRADRSRPRHGIHPSDADPGGSDPRDPGRPRPDRLRVHRHRQDGGIPALEPARPALRDATRMPDIGFLPDTGRILDALRAEGQTLMFSATIPPEIRKLADDILRDPVVVMVGAQKPVSGIVQSVYPVAQARKGPLLTTL